MSFENACDKKMSNSNLHRQNDMNITLFFGFFFGQFLLETDSSDASKDLMMNDMRITATSMSMIVGT